VKWRHCRQACWIVVVTLPCRRWRPWRPCAARALCPLKSWWAAVLSSRCPSTKYTNYLDNTSVSGAILQSLMAPCSDIFYLSRHHRIIKIMFSENGPPESKLSFVDGLFSLAYAVPRCGLVFRHNLCMLWTQSTENTCLVFTFASQLLTNSQLHLILGFACDAASYKRLLLLDTVSVAVYVCSTTWANKQRSCYAAKLAGLRATSRIGSF